ncbi:MAG: hypothetical protein ACFFE2_11935 [Candidatus Thorarchaeota archaeon]
MSSPGGFSFSISQPTDAEGIAIFELKRIARGRWEIIVIRVNHPDYEVDLAQSETRWTVTYV